MEDLQKFYNTEILEMPSNIASLLWRMDVNTGQRTNTKHNIMWLKTELFDHYNKAIKNMIVVAFCYFFPFQILDANTMFINKKIQTEACKNRWILIFTEAVNAMVKPVSTLYDCPFNNTYMQFQLRDKSINWSLWSSDSRVLVYSFETVSFLNKIMLLSHTLFL